MKAARAVARRKIEYLDIPDPDPLEEGEVLIKLEQISVCGSDIYLEYDAELSEEEWPLTPGAPCHECAGVVVESRDPEYREGQRVIVIPPEAAGMRELVVQTADRIIKLPEWGGLDDWVMCQHSGTALYSAKAWGNPVGKRIAVLGQGGIGLTFTMVAAKQGAAQIVAIDLEEYRCKKAMELGATESVNASTDDATESGRELTQGDMFDVVVDASGNPHGLNMCVDLARRGGQIISFSLVGRNGGGRVDFNHWNWMAKNLQLTATVIALTNEPVKEIREIVELRDRGWIDPGLLKTHNWRFSQAQEAFEMYRLRQNEVIKVAMEMP